MVWKVSGVEKERLAPGYENSFLREEDINILSLEEMRNNSYVSYLWFNLTSEMMVTSVTCESSTNNATIHLDHCGNDTPHSIGIFLFFVGATILLLICDQGWLPWKS